MPDRNEKIKWKYKYVKLYQVIGLKIKKKIYIYKKNIKKKIYFPFKS